MAQLKDTVIAGSLRVTDTTYTTNLNVASLTASQAVLTDADKNLISRDIYNRTTTGNLEWTAASTDIHLITKNTLAYWNGRYNSSTSNLAYCNKGAFGDAVTYAVDDATANGALGTGTGLTTERSVYYGLVTVNGSSQTRATGIYAPTTAGDSNQILKSSGGGAPSWATAATVVSNTSTTSGTDAFTTLTLGNNKNKTTTDAHSEGILQIYTASTGYHSLMGVSTTDTNYTHMLPNANGNLVSSGWSSSVGTTTLPVYLDSTDHILKTITSYEGNAASATALKNAGRLTDANITHIQNGGATLLQASSDMTTNKPMQDGYILHFHWDTNEAWDSQLFVANNDSDSMQWRSVSAAGTWGNWKTLVDLTNSDQITKVGTITSGTWQGSVISATYIDSNIERRGQAIRWTQLIPATSITATTQTINTVSGVSFANYELIIFGVRVFEGHYWNPVIIPRGVFEYSGTQATISFYAGGIGNMEISIRRQSNTQIQVDFSSGMVNKGGVLYGIGLNA